MHNTHVCVCEQVDNAHLSVATLTDEPLHKMVSIDTAPKIMAVVVGKGADYSSAAGYSDGKAQMPQVRVELGFKSSTLLTPWADNFNHVTETAAQQCCTAYSTCNTLACVV